MSDWKPVPTCGCPPSEYVLGLECGHTISSHAYAPRGKEVACYHCVLRGYFGRWHLKKRVIVRVECRWY